MSAFPFAFTGDSRHWFTQIPTNDELARYYVVNAPGVLLHREMDEPSLGVGAIPDEMPRILYLHDDTGVLTGALVVLLDNSLVMTTSRDLQEKWIARIRRNAGELNIDIKEASTAEDGRQRGIPRQAGAERRRLPMPAAETRG